MKTLYTNNSKSTHTHTHRKSRRSKRLLAFWGYALCILMVAFLGCSEYSTVPIKDNDKPTQNVLALTDEEQKILRYLDGDFTFAETEARKHAMDIAKKFDKVDGAKRTVRALIVQNLPVQTDSSKRTYIKTDSTPEFYIYNFAPSGFAIIAADERSMGHIASSMSSSIDSTMHVGYKLMLEGAVAEVLEDREKFMKERDSVRQTETFWNIQKKVQRYWEQQEDAQKSPLVRFFKNIYNGLSDLTGTKAYAQPTSVQRVYRSKFNIHYGRAGVMLSHETSSDILAINDTPLLRTNFHQQGPYNLKYDDFIANCHGVTNNGLPHTGCVATAYAQLLLYYNTQATRNKVSNLDKLRYYHYTPDLPNRDFPLVVPQNKGRYKDYDPQNANYTFIHESILNDAAANLHKRIRDNFPLVINGCEGGTFAWHLSGNAIINQHWGFQTGEFRDFEFDEVVQSLKDGKPVIIRGFAEGELFGISWLPVTDYVRAHVWVIDGAKIETVRYITRTTFENTPTTASFEDPNKTYYYDGPPAGGRFGTKTEVSSSITTRVEEIHHNWGWGESKTFQEYKASNWLRRGVFKNSKSSNATSFHRENFVIVNITPL